MQVSLKIFDQQAGGEEIPVDQFPGCDSTGIPDLESIVEFLQITHDDLHMVQKFHQQNQVLELRFVTKELGHLREHYEIWAVIEA